MKLSFVSLILLSILVFAACSTTPVKQDSLATPEAPRIDELPLPEETLLVLRVTPDEMNTAWEQATEVLNLPPGLARDVDILDLILFATLGNRGPLFGESLSRNDSPSLEGLDTSRSLLIALSVRGNEEHFRHIRHSLPPIGAETLLRNFSFRLYLPAINADQVKETIQSGAFGNPQLLQRVEIFGDYVVIDSHDDMMVTWARFFDFTPDEIDYTASIDQYWTRQTPAQQEFLNSSSAFSLYARNENLATLMATLSSLEAMEALERATPNRRYQMLSFSHQIIESILRLDGPDAHEYEDGAFIITANSDGQAELIGLRTFTTLGAAINAHSLRSYELPREHHPAPLMHFSWAASQLGAQGEEQVQVPLWLEEILMRGDGYAELANLFRYTGNNVQYLANLNYPRGFLKAFENLPMIGTPPMSNPYLLAAAGSLGWQVDESAPLGGALQGHLAAILTSNQETEFFLEETLGLLKFLANDRIEVSIENKGEEQHLLVRLGEFEGTNETQRLQAGHFEVALDSEYLQRSLPSALFESEPRLEQFRRLVAHFDRLDARAHTNEEAQRFVFRFDPEGEETSALSPSGITLLSPASSPSSCVSSLQRTSRKLLDNIGNLGRGSQIEPAFFEESIASLEGTHRYCGETTEREDRELHQWLKNRWYLALANQALMADFHDLAATLLDKSCTGGTPEACTQLEDLQPLQRPWNLPVLDSSPFLATTFGAPLPLLTPEKHFYFDLSLFHSRALRTWSSGEEIAAPLRYLPEALIHTGRTTRLGTILAPVTADTQLSQIQTILESSTGRTTWSIEEASFSGELEIQPYPLWVALVLETETDVDSNSASLPVIPLLAAEHLEHQPIIPVRIDAPSQTVIINDETLSLDEVENFLAREYRTISEPYAVILSSESEGTLQDLANFYEIVASWYARFSNEPIYFTIR